MKENLCTSLQVSELHGCTVLYCTVLYCTVLACRYLSCMAEELSEMVSEACFSARAAFCSPSAAITWGRRRIETLEKVEFVNASCLSLFMRVWCLAGLDLVLLGLGLCFTVLGLFSAYP